MKTSKQKQTKHTNQQAKTMRKTDPQLGDREGYVSFTYMLIKLFKTTLILYLDIKHEKRKPTGFCSKNVIFATYRLKFE
jgi:hypothetical protein